jgi:antirestriction protein ArdC
MAASKVQTTIAKIFIERIEALKAAGGKVVLPWRKPWKASNAQRNLFSGKAYRGANVWVCMASGFASPLWATLKSIQAAGGDLAEGIERKAYTPIIFWSWPTKEQKAEGKRPFCRFYQVYNVDQTVGLEDAIKKATPDVKPVADPIEAAEAVVNGWANRPPIQHGGGRAFYQPDCDKVTVPNRESFDTLEDYYHTLYHELGHSTGHRSRLGRDGIVNPISFGSHEYSEEELVAEMTASILAGHAGIESQAIQDNAAAYLDSWLSKLSKNPEWLMSAGGKAQKAADLILNAQWAEKAE